MLNQKKLQQKIEYRLIMMMQKMMIAAEFIFLYPPGIPLVVPGEVIDKYVIDKIRQYEQYNMKVIGLDDHKIYIINR